MNLGFTFLLPLAATVAHNNSLLPFCPFLSVDHPFVSFRSPPCFLSRSLSFILYCVFPSPGDPLPQAQLPPASISRCLPGSLDLPAASSPCPTYAFTGRARLPVGPWERKHTLTGAANGKGSETTRCHRTGVAAHSHPGPRGPV